MREDIASPVMISGGSHYQRIGEDMRKDTGDQRENGGEKIGPEKRKITLRDKLFDCALRAVYVVEAMTEQLPSQVRFEIWRNTLMVCSIGSAYEKNKPGSEAIGEFSQCLEKLEFTSIVDVEKYLVRRYDLIQPPPGQTPFEWYGKIERLKKELIDIMLDHIEPEEDKLN